MNDSVIEWNCGCGATLGSANELIEHAREVHGVSVE